MQTGEIVSGIITGIKDYGAFVKVGEYTGLIHISEFSDGFVKDINEIVAIKQTINALVLEVDEDGKKLKLSYKQANVIPSKLLEKIHILKGFNSLGVKLNEWIEKKSNEIKEAKENELH